MFSYLSIFFAVFEVRVMIYVLGLMQYVSEPDMRITLLKGKNF